VMVLELSIKVRRQATRVLSYSATSGGILMQ